MASFANKQLNNLVDAELEHLYELHPGVNERTLGRMYALKQFEKAASEEYAILRKSLDTSNVEGERTVISKDGAFQAVAQTRAGNSKIDPTLLRSALAAEMIKQLGSIEVVLFNRIIEQALANSTVFGNDVTTVSVIKS